MHGFNRYMAPLGALLLLTACGDTCVMFCMDQTRVQRQYVSARDECRNLAELRSGLSDSNTSLDRASKSKLVGHFSECMNSSGWAVPGPTEDKKKQETAAAATQTPALPLPNPTLPPPAPAQVQNDRAKRAADCAFSRQAAAGSVVSAKRAEACDMECAEMSRHAPDAPKPAACP